MINYEELESQSFLVNENDENERIDKFLAKKFDKCCRKWYISNTSRKNKNMRKIKRLDTNLTFYPFCAIIKVRKEL